MIRVSEMALPGHPDKFCDQIADAIIAECVAIDADAYGQVEVSTWSDHVWLSGGICTRKPLRRKLDEIVVETGLALGYRPGNHIDASRYKVTSTVCQIVDDPARWSAHVNDQSVVVGWAGYDSKTGYLPPEHYLAHAFRDGLIDACRGGPLTGQGPDGKLLVRLRDESDRWSLEHVLVTIQQTASTSAMDIAAATIGVLRHAYSLLQDRDRRWRSDWRDVAVMVNPNGPLVEAGMRRRQRSDGTEAGHGFLWPACPGRRRRALRKAFDPHRPHWRLRGARGCGARGTVRRG
jgi:S-adenosylmethionine synthetase